MQQRRACSEEVRREAVGPASLPGANVSQIARHPGIRANHIHRWRKELKIGGEQAFPGNGVTRDEEVPEFRRELAWVKS